MELAKVEEKLNQKSNPVIISPSWEDIENIVTVLTEKVKLDGIPEIIIGVLRGGVIPGIIISQRLGIRNFLPFSISRTTSESINAKKMAPRLGSNISFEMVAGKDILIVDDVLGTGATLRKVEGIMNQYAPVRIRSLVCIVNRENWETANENEPTALITYVGYEARGWVLFPWEQE